SFVASGDYFWNAGMFFFTIREFLNECRELMPEAFALLSAVDPDDPAQVTDAYNKVESISIDYAVMEKSRRISVIPADFSWNDIGDFSAIHELSDRLDGQGNLVSGTVSHIGCSNSFFHSSGRLVTGINLSGMAVIDSDDATLVCPLSDTQEVKKIYEILKKEGRSETMVHCTVYRPWGYYTVLDEKPGHKVKRITVYPGKRLSLQRHKRRSEHWTVVNGEAIVTKDSERIPLTVNQSVFLPVLAIHRVENPGNVDMQFVEVQVGDYLEEDDIERFEDDYGRR
ncbi:MAG: cupin domain-containing protein, partial [Candidatus Wallbacteria bacterium]|nr:cupin domain-containing protein [Candidatus Wallbacteria bacterium]